MNKYNKKYYNNGILKTYPNRESNRERYDSLNIFTTPDGILIGIFQGNRGTHPDLDFVVKILRPGENEKPEPPMHVAWVTDLLLRSESDPKRVKELVNYFINFYAGIVPFSEQKERNNHVLKSIDGAKKIFSNSKSKDFLSIEYTATIIELFCYCEKRNTGAHMFKNLLESFLNYLDKKIDFMTLINSAVTKKQY